MVKKQMKEYKSQQKMTNAEIFRILKIRYCRKVKICIIPEKNFHYDFQANSAFVKTTKMHLFNLIRQTDIVERLT